MPDPLQLRANSASVVVFKVKWQFHYVLRIPLDAPADPEVGVTTSTDRKGSW